MSTLPTTESLPLPHRVTLTTTLLLSSLCSGTCLTLSTFLVPRLLESPTPLMLTQWARTYARGAAVMPLAAVATAASYVYLGLRAPAPGLGLEVLRARAFLAAGALTAGIVPYTILVMSGTNGELKALEGEVGVGKVEGTGEVEVGVERERSAKGLVDWWGVLNLGRAGLLIAGAVCGLVAAV